MLQALNLKNINPKTASTVDGALAGVVNTDPESAIEGAEFANELLASLSTEETALKIKPVEVSPEQILEAPSKLIRPGAHEGIDPKVFDPALTQGVDKIIQPKTTALPTELTNEQVLKLAQGQTITTDVDSEITQAMLKTPQIQTARPSAVELGSKEVDSQLMNMEDFVAQKNMALKKSINNSSAYGVPAKGQAAKVGMDTGLKSTQVINELAAVDGGTNGAASHSMNSQQFILSSQIDMGANAKANEAQHVVKTFDMSHIKTDNPDQIMTQISDYIAQGKAAKEPTVNMRVNHDELGMIDITVNKNASSRDAIAINIGTHSADGKNFFQHNSKDLFAHLTKSGLNISDLKVETPAQTAKNDFDFGGQSSRGGFGQDRQFGSEQNQRRHESERRQDLWNLLKDKEAA